MGKDISTELEPNLMYHLEPALRIRISEEEACLMWDGFCVGGMFCRLNSAVIHLH